MDVPGKPDFAGIKYYLNKALFYATIDLHREAVNIRLN
jgi:hypothetical protein